MLLIHVVGYALLVPFFGWGIFLLRRRYLYYEENSMALELGTAIAVGLFFWIESYLLRLALHGQLLLLLAALLGLCMAGFALYAHVFISLASRLLVDMIAPGADSPQDSPRFGPVDALERDGEYEAALSEYLVLARIYPRNVEVLSRTAHVLLALDREADAEAWFLRARKRAKRADDALEAVNQLCRLYDGVLDASEKADYQLARFIRDFPDSHDVDIVRDRLSRRANKTDWSVSDFLEALEDDPLSDGPAPAPPVDPDGQAPTVAVPVELVALENAGAAEAPAATADAAQNGTGAPSREKEALTLSRLDEEPAPPRKTPQNSGRRQNGTRARKKTSGGSALEALQSSQFRAAPTAPEKQRPSDRHSSIGLDPMDEESS